jgi:hypothetical protein
MMFRIPGVGINQVLKQDFDPGYGILQVKRAMTGGFRHDGKDPNDT